MDQTDDEFIGELVDLMANDPLAFSYGYLRQKVDQFVAYEITKQELVTARRRIEAALHVHRVRRAQQRGLTT